MGDEKRGDASAIKNIIQKCKEIENSAKQRGINIPFFEVFVDRQDLQSYYVENRSIQFLTNFKEPGKINANAIYEKIYFYYK